MGSVFGKLLGGGKPKAVAGTAGGFESLPGQVQEQFLRGTTRAEALSKSPALFQPAAFTPDQLAAFNMLRQQPQPLTEQQFSQKTSMFMNPYLDQAVQPVINELQNRYAGTLSEIGQRASSAGGFGGTRQALLESEARRNLEQNIGDVLGQGRASAFNFASQSALDRIGREEDLRRQAILDRLGIGQQQQQLNQMARQGPLQATNYLLNALKTVPVGGGAQTYQDPGLLSRIGDAGSAAAGIGTVIGMFSDARLKTDISRVGELNGFNIYHFRYKNAPELGVFEGVMADEIKNKFPDAIGNNGGYMTVDYDRIGITFKRVS